MNLYMNIVPPSGTKTKLYRKETRSGIMQTSGIVIQLFVLQLFLMTLIFLSGNYNFFNILTVVLCLPLLDDEHVRFILPRWIGEYCSLNQFKHFKDQVLYKSLIF